jgi:hypothetical protein
MGQRLQEYCGATAPTTATAFGAASFGEDQHENTLDDIRSWEPFREE